LQLESHLQHTLQQLVKRIGHEELDSARRVIHGRDLRMPPPGY
jgi:hypothetical protein